MSLDRQVLLLAGLLGFLGVVMAAAGSHVDAFIGQEPAMQNWHAANLMHLFHSVALLALAALAKVSRQPLLRWIAWSWVAGVILFSGSIYLEILLGLPGTGGMAPVGGSLLIIGWLLVAIAAARNSK